MIYLYTDRQKFLKNSLETCMKNSVHSINTSNMDETPIFFDMVGTLTVDCRGAQSIPIRTTGNDKNRLTCVLRIWQMERSSNKWLFSREKEYPRANIRQ